MADYNIIKFCAQLAHKSLSRDDKLSSRLGVVKIT